MSIAPEPNPPELFTPAGDAGPSWPAADDGRGRVFGIVGVIVAALAPVMIAVLGITGGELAWGWMPLILIAAPPYNLICLLSLIGGLWLGILAVRRRGGKALGILAIVLAFLPLAFLVGVFALSAIL